MSTRIDTNLPFSVGVVNSEISSDVDVGVDVAADLGMSQIEIEDFWGRAAHECDDALIERTRNAVERGGLYVSSVGTQAFKVLILPAGDVCDPTAIDGWDQHRIELEGGIRVAQALDSPFVRIFSCRRDDMIGMGNPSPRLPMADRCRYGPPGRNLTVCATPAIALPPLNVRSWSKRPQLLGNTAVSTVRIWSHRPPPRRLNWDPPTGFGVRVATHSRAATRIARPWTEHVHVKCPRVDHATGDRLECRRPWRGDFVGPAPRPYRRGFFAWRGQPGHWYRGPQQGSNSRESFAGMLEVLNSPNAAVSETPVQTRGDAPVTDDEIAAGHAAVGYVKD